jgi:hypothetical protein
LPCIDADNAVRSAAWYFFTHGIFSPVEYDIGVFFQKENFMKNNAFVFRWLIAILVIAMSVQAPVVLAEMVDTDAIAAQSQAERDRAKVQSFLDRANVKERLMAMGVSGVLAKDRVAALSEEEVHALAQRIDSMPAGGNLSGNELIIILLIIILVAVLI